MPHLYLSKECFWPVSPHFLKKKNLRCWTAQHLPLRKQLWVVSGRKRQGHAVGNCVAWACLSTEQGLGSPYPTTSKRRLTEMKTLFFFTLEDFKYNYTPKITIHCKLFLSIGATVPFYCCELRYILVCINI